MKKFAITTIIAILIFSCSASSGIRSFESKYVDDLTFNMNVGRLFQSFLPVGAEYKTLMNSMKNVKVSVYESSNLMVSDLKRAVSNDRFESVISVNDPDSEGVGMYHKKLNNRNYYIFTIFDDDKLILLRADSNKSLNELLDLVPDLKEKASTITM